jgi:hypothetical protein
MEEDEKHGKVTPIAVGAVDVNGVCSSPLKRESQG